MQNERREKKKSAKQLAAPERGSHRLHVNRVNRVQHRRDERGRSPETQSHREFENHYGDENVQKEIHHTESRRPQSIVRLSRESRENPGVKPIGEKRKRTLHPLGLLHPPEGARPTTRRVVLRPVEGIVFDQFDIVENETSVQSGEIGKERGGDDREGHMGSEPPDETRGSEGG